MHYYCIFLLILSGCTKEDVSIKQEVSPTFKSEDAELQGTEGRIAILGPEFIAGKTNKHMWHFWGTKEELSEKKIFKVEAINIKTGEKSKALVFGADTDSAETVWQYEGSLGGPNHGADSHLPSSMMLPGAGIWRKDAYLDGKLFGSVTIEAR